MPVTRRLMKVITMKRTKKMFAGIIGMVVVLSIFSTVGLNTSLVTGYYEETIIDTLSLITVAKAWGSWRTYWLKITTRVGFYPGFARILSQSLYLYTTTGGWWPPLLWGFNLYYQGTYGGESYYWRADSPTIYDNGNMWVGAFRPTDSDSFTGLTTQDHIVLKYRWHSHAVNIGRSGEYSPLV